MAKQDPVTEEECDGKMSEVFKRVNSLDKSVAKIFGAVAALMFLSTFVFAMVGFHINQRFSSFEKTVDKMDNRLIEYLDKKPQG